MRTIEQDQDPREGGLPPSVQQALGELLSAAKDGLLALSVGVGLGVLAEMMEAKLDEARASATPTAPRCATARLPKRPKAAGIHVMACSPEAIPRQPGDRIKTHTREA